jgi:hypothetical protein
MQTKVLMATVALIGGLLAGCYQSPDVKLHKPGVYKGVQDPLIQKEASPEQQKALIARFNEVQTDR